MNYLKMQDAADRSFVWADNSYVDYVNWNGGEPNNYLDSEGLWNI